MICNRCGQNIPDNSTICNNCGNVFNSNNKQVKNKNKKKEIFLFIGLLCLVIILYFGINSFSKYKKEVDRQNKIQEYLKEKYNEEFDLELKYIGNESEVCLNSYTNCSMSTSYAYVYEMKPKNGSGKYYIAYSYGDELDSGKVEELTNLKKYINEDETSDIQSVGRVYTYEEVKIKEEIEEILGSDYTVTIKDYQSDNIEKIGKRFWAKTEKTFAESTLIKGYDQKYEKLIDLAEKTESEIMIDYKENTNTINNQTRERYEENKKMAEKVKPFIGNEYKVNPYGMYFALISEKTTKDIMDNDIDGFMKLYNNIIDILDTDKRLEIIYTDKYLYIRDGSEKLNTKEDALNLLENLI